MFTTALFHVIHEGPSGVDGYVAYRVRQDWSTPLSGGLVKIAELMANSDDAYRALWSYCFNIDLTARIRARHGEVDGKLSLAVAENHAHAVVQCQAVGGGVELGKRGLQRVRGGFGLRLDDHAFPCFPL